MSERELVFDAVKATMNQLKGSYSIISLISQARMGSRGRSPTPAACGRLGRCALRSRARGRRAAPETPCRSPL